MSEWPSAVTAVTLFVDDLAAATQFYLDVFGLPVLFEDDDSVAFRFGTMIVNLLRASEAGELIDPATVAPAAAGSRFQFTIEVDDVDATYAELSARGVVFLNGPIDRPWGIRTAAFQDPGGHVWEIAK